MFQFDGAFGVPGIYAALQTVENQFWVDRFENQIWTSELIVGSARDTGNTSYTDILRPGLILGRVTSTGKLKEWNATGTDGSQYVYGILGYAQKMQRLGADLDRWLGYVMVAGNLRASRLLIPASTTFGISGATSEFILRAQMHPRFMLDDLPWGNACGGWRDIRAVTDTTLTVTAADNNTLFTNRGAGGNLAVTLPATAYKGLRYGFFTVAAGTLTITAGTADTMVVFNDSAADSIAYSTASEIIGNMVEVIGDGTGWLTINHLGAETATPTIAT